LVLSATLVAVTVTVDVVVTLGEVNNPLLEMVPPEADQTTAVFEVLLAVAVNCCEEPEMVVMDAGEIVIATGGTGTVALLIAIEKVAFPREFFTGSVTVTVKAYVPAVVGVPEISPLVLKNRPAGKLPPVTKNWYGAVPPKAVKVALYAVETVPDGRLAGEIISRMRDWRRPALA
jgi:hypothetical protein